MKYKEGKDFEWVPMKDKDGKVVKDGRGGAVKTRRFFTKAEKEAMKSGDKPKAKPKSEPKAKPKAKPEASRADTTDDARAARTNSSEKYGTGSGPRTAAPKKETPFNAPSVMEEGPTLSGNRTSSGGAPINRSTPDSEVKAGYGSLANARNRMESFRVSRQDKTINGVSFDEWKKLTRAQRVEKNLPLTNQEFMRAMRLKGADSAPVVPKSSKDTTDDARARATRTNRSRNSPDIPGMAKGGMVKSGNKDYKKSGMFYKSGSPRGYK